MIKRLLGVLYIVCSMAFLFSCENDDDNVSTQQEESQNANKPDSTNTNESTDTTGSNLTSDTTGTVSQGVSESGKVGLYSYVDLGLPSGTKWATCNVGASKPEEFGDYFAWGETKQKENYTWSTYKWCNGSSDTQTKYCVDSLYGTVDGLTTLLAEDDAATVNWGAGWRMPTKDELDELQNGCDWKLTYSFNGGEVAGFIGISKANGNSIFLPAAGFRDGIQLIDAGNHGSYCSSSFYENNSSLVYSYDYILSSSDNIDWKYYCSRSIGRSVRAVVQ